MLCICVIRRFRWLGRYSGTGNRTPPRAVEAKGLGCRTLSVLGPRGSPCWRLYVLFFLFHTCIVERGFRSVAAKDPCFSALPARTRTYTETHTHLCLSDIAENGSSKLVARLSAGNTTCARAYAECARAPGEMGLFQDLVDTPFPCTRGATKRCCSVAIFYSFFQGLAQGGAAMRWAQPPFDTINHTTHTETLVLIWICINYYLICPTESDSECGQKHNMLQEPSLKKIIKRASHKMFACCRASPEINIEEGHLGQKSRGSILGQIAGPAS